MTAVNLSFACHRDTCSCDVCMSPWKLMTTRQHHHASSSDSPQSRKFSMFQNEKHEKDEKPYKNSFRSIIKIILKNYETNEAIGYENVGNLFRVPTTIVNHFIFPPQNRFHAHFLLSTRVPFIAGSYDNKHLNDCFRVRNNRVRS